MTEVIVRQPRIEVPKRSDPLFWSKMKKIHTEWSRNVCNQLGLNSQKNILGQVLSSIIGDDENCFIPLAASFDKKDAISGKQKLRLIVDWELETPETPHEIKEELRSVQDIFSTSWEDENDYSEARNIWTGMKIKVEQIIKDTPMYEEALEYHSFVDFKTHDLWEEFQKDRKLVPLR